MANTKCGMLLMGVAFSNALWVMRSWLIGVPVGFADHRLFAENSTANSCHSI